MRIGLDFGTTNSGAALYDGRRVRLIPLDPADQVPTVMRSVLYVTREHQVLMGREAIETYYRQNIGRPSRLVRQRVGEIEITQADVGSIKGYPTGPSTFVMDVYALVDELTPGRLLRSLKSGLAGDFAGTTIFGRFYPLEELIARFLREVRLRVEREIGAPVDGVVLGRPVHFAGSESETDDRRGEERLHEAAREAGFREVVFELEPVAAALHYELATGKPGNVLVFDLGGGTLDITVMRLGDPRGREVYATGGVAVAGDVFDQRIIGGTLLDRFGRGSTFRPRAGARDDEEAPFPARYTDALLNWQTALELNKPETLRFLRSAQATSSNPRAVRALESLVVDNYAMRLYDEVERAKIALSSAAFDVIRLVGEGIDVWQPIARSQFESLIAAEVGRVEACVQETVARSGLAVEAIDVVVRTGGSAQIPCLMAMLGRLFGPEKVVLSEVFTGVTAGLAIRAHRG
jgi:hypothetical chaperone protein